MVTDQNANIVARHDYLPFGEEVPNTIGGRTSIWGASDSFSQKFTGKERDQESGLDYFGARYYGSALGRFTSPDWSAKPEPVPYADFENPQSLNQYTYSSNNPLSKTDPDGHCDVDGEHHWGWCIWHDLGFYETQKDRVDQARNFFNNNNILIGGNHVDSSHMTDQKVLAAFKQYDDAYRAESAAASRRPTRLPPHATVGAGGVHNRRAGGDSAGPPAEPLG